jgi:hypothetical protein
MSMVCLARRPGGVLVEIVTGLSPASAGDAGEGAQPTADTPTRLNRATAVVHAARWRRTG